MEKLKQGVGRAIQGLTLLQERADKEKDVMSMMIILGVALALQQICEAVDEMEGVDKKIGVN